MHNRIYVRNRQTLANYRYRFFGKPYAVRLEPYQRKSLEWDSQHHGYGRRYRNMMRKTDGVLEIERYEDKDGLYVIHQPFRITGYYE
jgi:hypothetical protein